MKKSLLLFVLVFAMILGGCGNGDSDIPLDREPIELVIIAGKHANSNNFTDDMLERAAELIELAVDYDKSGNTYSAEVQMSLIVCDGKPKVEKMKVGKSSKLKTTADNKKLFKENVTALLSVIGTQLASDDVMAKERGSDLQGALNQAGKILRSKDAEEKHILIMDTGICTDGYLDMNTLKIQDGTLEQVMEQISPSAFPDLDGVNITFLGLGNVAQPQEDFGYDEELEQRLVEFWTAYLEEGCGAILTEDILFSNDEGEPLSSNEDLEHPYPFVPTVDFTPSENKITPPPEVLKLEPFYSAELGFKPNSSEFRNTKEALKVIEKRVPAIKKYFEQNPGKVVYIVGSIARVSPDETLKKDNKYSQGRAQKVFEVLTSPEFGFNPSQFVVIDAGTNEFTWRSNQEFENGVKNSANQEANRLVALISETDTERVQELKDAGEL